MIGGREEMGRKERREGGRKGGGRKGGWRREAGRCMEERWGGEGGGESIGFNARVWDYCVIGTSLTMCM